MNPERWQQIDKLLEEVLERPREQRAAFLDAACGGDESLREEVEALLAAHERQQGVLDSPALEVAARGIAAGGAGSLKGRQLGPYQIVSFLGAGGMGEVYRARDTKLRREVALKILPIEYHLDSERTARLEREARMLAALNHPNVAAIYGLEELDEKHFLVLELVEGTTLAERLSKGPLPIDEALKVCRQIAEGLEAAQEKGIIHRDLKPANVKITPEGKAKILDFGLAKAYQKEGSVSDLSKSPTLTGEMTREGVILGTAAYMSPEQAMGKAVDKRSDIWAFGCVMFECLTGKKTFEGETVTEILAAILKGEPNWELLPAATPWKVKDLLHRCLQKDPRERLHDIADARIEVMEALNQPLAREDVPAKHAHRSWIVVALILGFLLGGMAYLFVSRHFETPSPLPVVRFVNDLPAGTQLTRNPRLPIRTELALSPDGKEIVFSASTDGMGSKAILYRRAMDQPEANPIGGTENARQPFYSPDGKWIGFWANQKLYKIGADGGIPKDLGSCPDLPMGACWSDDGKIILGGEGGLRWIPAEGGLLTALTKLDPTRDVHHTLPFALPGGKAVLFTAMPDFWGSRARVEVAFLSNGSRRMLIEDGADARYISTGHLVFLRQGLLMAAPFDLARMEVSGPAFPVLKGVKQALDVSSSDDHSGAGQFSLSRSGTLVWAPGGISHNPDRELVWLDRQGRVQMLAGFDRPQVANQVRFSPPDGRRLAFIQSGMVWLFDVERATYSKLSPEGMAAGPQWTPDGKRLAFAWSAAGPLNVWVASMEGSGKLERMIESKFDLWPSSWSLDGHFLAVVEINPETGNDIVIYRMEDRKVIPFLNSHSDEEYPEFSPDGRWMAYVSDDTGRREVYLRSFPDGRQKFSISNQGGIEPVWSSDGGEVFYESLAPPRKLMKVDISLGPKLSVGLPKVLFEFPFAGCGPIRGYDLHPDGRRFLGTRAKTAQKSVEITRLNIVLNWFEELKRLAPVTKK